MRDFFDALQNASNDPLDTASRQFVISRGVALSERFNSVAERIDQQRVDLNGSLEGAATRVNEIANLVAEVNRRISLLQDGRDSNGLNAMIDQRDNLLKELSEWVGINTSIQSDGQANVFAGKGQSLVLGSQTAELSVADNGAVYLRQVGTSTKQEITSSISGGEMGGLLSYREQVLDAAQSELGHLAATIAYAFNAQHNLGIDLAGNFGMDFFSDLNDPNIVGQRVGILAGEAGASSIGQVNVYIEDPLSNPPASYEVRIEADGAFSVKRQSDGAMVYQGSSITPPMNIEFDGLRVEFADGSFNPGDTMLLRPYASYATEMSVQLTDPPSLALGAPIALAPSATNNGSAVMSVAEITDPNHPIFSGDGELFPPLLVRFVNESQYEILDNSDPTNPQRLVPDLGLRNYLQGSQNHVLPYLEGSTIVASEGPQVSVLPASAVLVSDLSLGSSNYPGGGVTADNLSSGASQSVSIAPGSSARDIANAFEGLSGISATARTTVSLTNLVNYESGVPVEMAVNGELITGFASLNELADGINANVALQSQGIVARSDGQVLTLTAQSGDDITLHFQGDPNESITVSDVRGGSMQLNGNVAGTYRRVTVGGEVSALIAPDVRISPQLDGLFAANPVQTRADFGFDLLLSGNVAAGDEFAVSFNADAVGDNRNGQALARLSEDQIIGDPPVSFGAVFSSLILDVGAAASQAEVNRTAAEALLEQSESFRESISGVNLDEEAANLIRFEQAYNASAQIISVARDTFNTLLNAFR
jgi:flagellar hook-associated protein 1 FlgK